MMIGKIKSVFKTDKTSLFLIAILLLAVFLRFYKLDQAPIELCGDELDVGYQAFSLWTTGKDYLGNSFPVYLRSFSQWRTPLLSYLIAPVVGLWGLNGWTVRFLTAFLGVVNIALIYFLTVSVSGKKRLALLASLICAVIPWHLHYSRLAFDTTLLLTTVMLGTLFFIKGRLFFSAVSYVLSFYVYNTAYVFVPLMVLSLIFIFKKRFNKITRSHFFACFTFALLSIPLVLTMIFGEGTSRFKIISIFNDPKAIDEIVYKRNTGISPSFERFFYNKPRSILTRFANNYITSFSPQFLFISGDPNPRHNVPGFGEFYFVLLPFLVIGIIKLSGSKDAFLKKIIFVWLMLAPIASALTLDGGNHATRLSLMIPPLVILIAYGVHVSLKSNKLLLVFLGVFFLSLTFWFHEYLVHYNKEQYKYWHYGYREIFSWLKANDGQYPNVILNNRHDPVLLRYAFWAKKDPKWIQENYKGEVVTKDIFDGFDGFTVGPVFLGEITVEDKIKWLADNLDKKTVYLAFQKDEVSGDWNWYESPPKGIKVLKFVNNPLTEEPYIYLLTRDHEDE